MLWVAKFIGFHYWRILRFCVSKTYKPHDKAHWNLPISTEFSVSVFFSAVARVSSRQSSRLECNPTQYKPRGFSRYFPGDSRGHRSMQNGPKQITAACLTDSPQRDRKMPVSPLRTPDDFASRSRLLGKESLQDFAYSSHRRPGSWWVL